MREGGEVDPGCCGYTTSKSIMFSKHTKIFHIDIHVIHRAIDRIRIMGLSGTEIWGTWPGLLPPSHYSWIVV